MLAGWGPFLLAGVVFLASHAIPVRPPVKPWIVSRIGAAGFTLVYSLLSVAVVVWLVIAAGRAPFVEIWPRAAWQDHVTLSAMVLAVTILSLALLAPNPLSFGGWRNARFDPAAPGIVGVLRHPILAVLALWSLGHLAPNGDLAHVILFGGFSVFALMGGRMIDRRHRRMLGTAEWSRLARATGFGMPARELGLRLMSAAALLAALVVAHPYVIGLPAVQW